MVNFMLICCNILLMMKLLTTANTEVVTDDEDGLQHVGTTRPPDVKKKKGIRGLFGK